MKAEWGADVERVSVENVEEWASPGDICAFGDRSLLSRIIQWAQGSNVGHVATLWPVYPAGGGKRIVAMIEAIGAGVSVTSFRHRVVKDYPRGNVWWLVMRAEVRRRLDVGAYHDFLAAQLGQPFDFKQAPGSVFSWIRNRRSGRKWFCSELVGAALQVGRVLRLDVPASEITPADLVSLSIWEDTQYVAAGWDLEPMHDFNTVSMQQFKKRALED